MTLLLLESEELDLPREQWDVAFQSQFGKEEWLRPYTDETLEKWGEENLESVDVICPGFSADCLETIDEIGRENLEAFRENAWLTGRIRDRLLAPMDSNTPADLGRTDSNWSIFCTRKKRLGGPLHCPCRIKLPIVSSGVQFRSFRVPVVLRRQCELELSLRC